MCLVVRFLYKFPWVKQVILAFAESDTAYFEEEQAVMEDLIHLSLHTATDLEINLKAAVNMSLKR